MKIYALTRELLSPSERALLDALRYPLTFKEILRFDLSLGGPSITRLSCHGTGRYYVQDRSIFRPLQYRATCFGLLDHGDLPEWLARYMVHMSGLHLETLLRRLSDVRRPLPLGRLLFEPSVRRILGPTLWGQLGRFRAVYNAAKHEADQPKYTHLFSIGDAVSAYVIARKVGLALYSRALLRTDMAQFERSC